MLTFMSTAYIALGANLNEPASQIRKAMLALASLPYTGVIKKSSLYRTAPIGVTNHPDYINAVVEIKTSLTPADLLDALLALEANFGRTRKGGVSPRTLDLDVLLYAQEQINTDTLTVPHPRMHLRAFVLQPLLEIAPDCQIPGLGRADDYLAGVADQPIEILQGAQ